MEDNTRILLTPERAGVYHATIGGCHAAHIAGIIADVKVVFFSILLHPDVGSLGILVVRQLEPFVGVDRAPACHCRVISSPPGSYLSSGHIALESTL